MARPIYNPFSWNAPGNTLQDLYNWYLTGGDEATDDTIGGTGVDTGVRAVAAPGGDSYGPYNPDPNRTRTKADYSPFAARRAFAEPDSEVGIPSGILSDSQFLYGDQVRLPGILGMGQEFLKQILPVNSRAILENELLGKGIMIDDIGRIVADNINTPEGVMAGYNAARMDASTFDDRIANIEKTIARKRAKGEDVSNLENRIELIEQAKTTFFDAKKIAGLVEDEKLRAKGKTPLSDQVKTNKAKLDMQQKIKDEDLGDLGDSGDLVDPWPVSPTDEIGVVDFTPGKINIEKRRIGMPEHLTSDIERERNRQLIELAEDLNKLKEFDDSEEERKEFLIKEKKKKDLDFLMKTPLEQIIEEESKVLDLPEPGSISLSEQIAINKAKQDMQQKIKAAEKKVIAKHHGTVAHGPGGRFETANTAPAPKQRDYSTHTAYGLKDGGLIRRPYGKGGIVDLL